MALHVVRSGLSATWNRTLRPSEVYRYVRNQIVLASGLEHCKYVLFDGKVFIDSFAPHFPSPAFDAVLGSFGAGVLREREFVDYAVQAITNRCMFRCQHCYAIDMLKGKDDLSVDQLVATAAELQRIGVGVLSLEGGEPLLRFDALITVLGSLKPETAPWIATTGYSLTEEKARALKRAGLVGATISLDHYRPEDHNAVRGNEKAFDAATRAVSIFRENGIFPVVAIVPSRKLLAEGGLYRYLELGKQLGVGMIQVLDPMPSGRYLQKKEERCFFSRRELQQVIDFQIEVNTDPRYKDYPAISSRAYVEDERRFGCGMGGNQYIYVDASGNLQPCVYLNASFGNVNDGGFERAYRRMRETLPHPVGGPCPVFSLHREVARHHRAGATLPLDAEKTVEICRRVRDRALPGIFARIEK